MAVHPTGIDHGTVTVVADHHPFEVTTLRHDVETDGRRAKVAFTDDKGTQRMKTLQSVANKALVFVNPAVGGMATTLGGLFHPATQARTAIWALSGTAAPRDLGPALSRALAVGASR